MLNVQKAMNYNQACGYPPNLIQIILSTVGGPAASQWSDAGLKAVSDWQKSKGLGDDGMVGPKTLAKLIKKLKASGKSGDAAQLQTFWDQKKVEQDGVIEKFSAPNLIYPFKFRKMRAKHPGTGAMCDWWSANGTFEVSIKLHSALTSSERERYEYRQYIKGDAWVQEGSWDASKSVWTPTSPTQVDIGRRFEVPGDPALGIRDGLDWGFKEDGKLPEHHGVFRFGRRDVKYDTDRFKSKWWPGEDGANYVLRDTPGYGEPYTPGAAPKVHMRFTFRGVVVEVELVESDSGNSTKVVREIESKTWTYTFDETLKPWTIF